MFVASIYEKYGSMEALPELMQGDYTLSALIPAMENGIPALRAFLYAAGAGAQTCRPFAWLSVSWESGALLRFAHCAAQDFMDTQRHPLSERIATALPQPLSMEEYMAEGRGMAKALDNIRAFCFAPMLNKEQIQALNEFDRLLARRAPAALLPYYHGLSPAFYAWMNDQNKEG